MITMRGYIEVKEDSYENTIEHLHKIKALACKLIKTMSESSEAYDSEDYEEEHPSRRNRRGRYGY